MRNWWSIYPIWVKYCGVCDEYVSLKSKWKYITSIEGLNALPNMDETFRRLDHLIEETDEKFRPMFDKTKFDDINAFRVDLTENRLNDLQQRFFSLAHYLGILKFVFFQRTVSLEIPEVVSGLPLSTERTIGNEAIYLAADNVAKRYRDCINIDSKIKWDGAVSFVYPIQESYFFGAYSRPDRYLNQFHILLSEENKHFLGSLLFLAHEISHAAHFKIKDKGLQPNWLVDMWRKVAGDQIDRFSDEISSLAGSCNRCVVWQYLNFILANDEEFRQNVADLIALLIGGPATCFALFDFLNSAQIGRYLPLRAAFLHGYCSESGLGEYRTLLEIEIMKMKEGWDAYLPLFASFCPNATSTPCYDILLRMGARSGKVFAFFESRILEELRTELPTETVIYPPSISTLTSAIVKDKFVIASSDEERICSDLLASKTLPSEDPRNILHCYYKLFRERTAPDYATTLYSLAYNTFQKNGGGS